MLNRITWLTVVLLASQTTTAMAGPSILYVDDDATAGGDGLAWNTAFAHLQDALAAATSGTEIRVAGGTYNPDTTDAVPAGTDSRSATFQLINDVSINGGYRGLAGGGSPDDRDIAAFESILSGNIGDTGNNADNSYHVINGSGTDNSAILHGSTIRDGNSDAANPDDDGAGLFIVAGSPSILQCTFTANNAGNGGGAVHIDGGGAPQFNDCDFIANFAGNDGGAIKNVGGGTPGFDNCDFIDNEAVDNGGAIGNFVNSSSTISGCLFENNTSGDRGGAIFNENNSNPVISNNTRFSANTSTVGGGAIHNRLSSNPVVSNGQFLDNSAPIGGAVNCVENSGCAITSCVFAANEATGSDGGAIHCANGILEVETSQFVDNTAAGFGGGIAGDDGSNLEIHSCIFSGNQAVIAGGGIIIGGIANVANCLFTGNIAELGAGLKTFSSSPDTHVDSCTFAANAATDTDAGAGAHLSPFPNVVSVENCILWRNVDDTDGSPSTDDDAQIVVILTTGTATIQYSAIQDANPNDATIPFSGSPGNIDDDPLFVGGSSAIWTANATYDPATGQTTLTDANAAYAVDELAGFLLNPDTTQFRQTLIVSNTATQIVVWGDFTAEGVNGAIYEINDYHLQDSSPARDAGNNALLPADALDLDADSDLSEDLPLDLDGDRRVQNLTVDMGVFEAFADCNGNGIDDLDDIDPGDPDGNSEVSADCNGNLVPDECDVSAVASVEKENNSAEDDEMGFSVAIEGDLAVAGRPFNFVAGLFNAGSIDVFQFDGVQWNQDFLFASDQAADDQFGYSVATDGDRIVAGAPFDDNSSFSNNGGAYVFRFDGIQWVQEQKLIPADTTTDLWFGWSVAIDGEIIVIGARRDDHAGSFSGSAYVFRFDGASWNQEEKLTASDAGGNDEFGYSVAIDSDRIAVGARLHDNAFQDAGAVYVFDRADGLWVETDQLFASDATSIAVLGTAVAVDGARIIAGAHNANGEDINTGAAYVFFNDGNQWLEEAKLTASDGILNDNLGISVSISNNRAVAGAPGRDQLGNSSGAAYVFAYDGNDWNQELKLLASDGAPNDFFGNAVAMDANRVVVGSPRDDDLDDDAGSVYFFQLGGDCDGDGLLDECEIDMGSPDVNLNSVPDECEEDCNGNGVPDCADIDPLDLDGDGFISCDENLDDIPDECQVINLNTDLVYATIFDAISAAEDDDELLVAAQRFTTDIGFEFQDKRLTLISRDEITQSNGWIFTDDTHLEVRDVPVATLECEGVIDPNGSRRAADIDVLIVDALGNASILASSLDVMSMNLEPGTGLDIDTDTGMQLAFLVVDVSGLLNHNRTLTSTGFISLAGGVIASDIVVDVTSSFSGWGTMSGQFTNNNEVTFFADTLQFGANYINNGTTTIQNGVLTIVESLINNGTILGDFVSRSGINGMTVLRDYVAGPGATLSILGGQARIGGDYDVAIDDIARYNMETADLRMVGLAGSSQSLETMSSDIGCNSAGLDSSMPGHFPLGAIHIGPATTTVTLVDNHDNDEQGQSACEALYVQTLVIDAGATLNTGSCRVYYDTLVLNGNVDNPDNLIELIGGVFGDIDNDSDIDGEDTNALVAVLTGAPLQPEHTNRTDLNCDGSTNGLDIQLFIDVLLN